MSNHEQMSSRNKTDTAMQRAPMKFEYIRPGAPPNEITIRGTTFKVVDGWTVAPATCYGALVSYGFAVRGRVR